MEAMLLHLRSLICLNLFTYTVKLFYAVPQMCAEPNLRPAAMQYPQIPSSPDIYVDFVSETTGLSREMASWCSQRDLTAIDPFIQSRILLRQLDEYKDILLLNPRYRDGASSLIDPHLVGFEYFSALFNVLRDPILGDAVDRRAEDDEIRIRKENREADDAAMVENLSDATIDQLVANSPTSFHRVVSLLHESQRGKMGQAIIAWYWNVAGLTKPFGLLQGNLKARQSWRYAPSNDLLATLVQLAAIDTPEWDDADPRPRPIGLRQFLEWLELRFGILVDRPPAPYTGAEYVAAAQENLAAMLHRLQQMGIYRGLSDDFTVQRLIPPYMDD